MSKTDELRERAEKELQKAKEKCRMPRSLSELVHELQVHQVELQMQNEELRKSQEEVSGLYNQYHELYDYAPVGYFSLDNEGIIRTVNVKGAELLQLNKKDIIGRGFSRFISKNVENKYYHGLANAIDTHEIQSVELQLKGNKKVFYVNIEIMPIYDKPGEMYHITVNDINERKKAEKELKESEEKYRTLFDSIDEGFCIVEVIFDNNKPIDYRFLEINPAFEKQTGLHDAKGKLMRDLRPKHEEHWFEIYGKIALTGKSIRFENPAIELNRYYDVYAFKIGGPESRKVAILFNDINERKKSEEALKKNEARFRAFVEASSDVIYRMNPDWAEMRQLQGRKFIPDTCNPSKRWMDKYIPPDDQPYVQKVINKAIKTKSVFELEHRVLQVDGTLGWTFSRAIPLFDKDNNIVEWFGSAKDVTDRKKAEEALKHAHNTLEERVDEQTVELKSVIDELRRSNEELEQFAYVASHDLQEPLRTIASFTQLLERRYKGKFDEDADEFMDFVINAAVQMKEQVEGLLEYSRIARHGKEFKSVKTNDILNQTINNLNASIKESNAEITCDKLPIVMGDDIQLQRVFQNIISNAIRFRKCEEPLKIHISSHIDKENNEYVFSVSDNGIGIEEQYLERIFVIFQRLHTREIYKGTGIGLSIVKKVIDRHGGHVWIESELGKGSTFYFTIPFKPTEVGGGAFLKKGLK